MRAKHKQSGFTIVELLVVIVVIAILASITVVAYTGVQQRANNSARLSEFNQWRKLYEMYKVQNGTYPTMADGGYCLGTGFPGGKCRDYLANNGNTLSELSSAPLMDKIKTIATLPLANHAPINGTVGPYVYYGGGWLQMTGVFNGGASDCPKSLSYTWDDGNGRLLCYIDLQI
jgi:prepilin-type N-terminal cleavage/methylation domain-containing protein